MKGGSHKVTAFGWLETSEDNGETVISVGGKAATYLNDPAGGNLLLGDLVYLNGAQAGSVTKNVTALNYANVIAGVAIAGRDSTYNGIIQDDAAVGNLIVAKPGESVKVAYSGIVKMVADGAVTINSRVIPSGTTAGRIVAGTTAGQIVGIALDAAAGAGSVIRVLLRFG